MNQSNQVNVEVADLIDIGKRLVRLRRIITNGLSNEMLRTLHHDVDDLIDWTESQIVKTRSD